MADSVERRLDALEKRLQSLPQPLRIEDLPLELRLVWYPVAVETGIRWEQRDLASFDGTPVEVRQERPSDAELRNTVTDLRRAVEDHPDDDLVRQWLGFVEPLPMIGDPDLVPAPRDVPQPHPGGLETTPTPLPRAKPRAAKPKTPAPSGSLFGAGMTDVVIQRYEPGGLGGRREGHSRWRGIGRD